MPLPNQNWIPDKQPRRGLMAIAPTPGGSTPPGITSNAQGVTRQVQANELAGTHMEELGRGDNRILQQARQRGVMAGAARGGINSNLAAAGGEAAWLDAAGNVAMQQAGAYGNAATQNLDSLGRQRISAEGNETQLGVAGIGADASMYNADLDFESTRLGREQDRELTLSDREYRSGESQRDRDFTSGRDETQHGYTRELERDRYNYDQDARDNDLNRTISGETFTRWLDDPETWDENDLSGAFELYNRIFRPNRARPK